MLCFIWQTYSISLLETTVRTVLFGSFFLKKKYLAGLLLNIKRIFYLVILLFVVRMDYSTHLMNTMKREASFARLKFEKSKRTIQLFCFFSTNFPLKQKMEMGLYALELGTCNSKILSDLKLGVLGPIAQLLNQHSCLRVQQEQSESIL